MTDTDTLLERGVEQIYPSRSYLEDTLKSGKKLRVYWGVDPTGELSLHHLVPMFKLRHFQDLGHKVIILIGSFTAMIGDPTGKSKVRVPLTKEQVIANAQNYKVYAEKIMDFDNNPPEIVFNGDWLEKLTFKEVVELSAHFTVQQMIERDMFQERLKANLPIGLHEFLYPLMQGYDSVMLDVDVEIGGTDQTFNMLAGRKLLEQYKNKEKIVLTTSLLVSANGSKMSKSDGTGIPLDLSPRDLYGKIMSLPDGFIVSLFLLTSSMLLSELSSIQEAILKGENPMQFKKKLAYHLTSLLHGVENADISESYFESTVQKDDLPDDIPVWKIDAGIAEISELVFNTGLVESKGEARRLVKQGAVVIIDGSVEKKIEDPRTFVELKDGMIIRVGKRRYVKVHVK